MNYKRTTEDLQSASTQAPTDKPCLSHALTNRRPQLRDRLFFNDRLRYQRKSAKTARSVDVVGRNRMPTKNARGARP